MKFSSLVVSSVAVVSGCVSYHSTTEPVPDAGDGPDVGSDTDFGSDIDTDTHWDTDSGVGDEGRGAAVCSASPVTAVSVTDVNNFAFSGQLHVTSVEVKACGSVATDGCGGYTLSGYYCRRHLDCRALLRCMRQSGTLVHDHPSAVMVHD